MDKQSHDPLGERKYKGAPVFSRCCPASMRDFASAQPIRRFGEFARSSGACNGDELPTHVEPFVEEATSYRNGRPTSPEYANSGWGAWADQSRCNRENVAIP